ncbi:hemolysin family protein [Streptococcus merionis]|uniref:hemolysin family protein n=1 Tax=Streptococcus merionis TaxID=400065 RepID=UPI0026E999F3|nr:hemolysin family protein [Streptococcus merionis]
MEDPGSQNIWLQFLLLLFLTLLNAFFSASEMALVSLNRGRVQQKAEDGERKYVRLLKVLESPDKFLSTIQVGITIISLLTGASFTDALATQFTAWLGGGQTMKIVAQVAALALLTYISIVLGELYPKRIALNLKENLAVISAPIILFLSKIAAPFVWLLSASTNLLSRITPMKLDDADENMTRDEIAYMLTNSEQTLEAEEIEMLQGIFSLDELVAREVMVHRTDTFMVDINDDTETIIRAILKQVYSRVPVYDDDRDKIIGIIHTKSLLSAAYEKGFDQINLRKLLQEPLFVPETIFVDDLLREFRSNQKQMAILLDEYGGVSGLVTLEDLLEEIVGEIYDETDRSELEVREIGEHTYIVEGTMTLNDFNEYFDTELESEDVDTIAGFYLTGMSSIPDQSEKESIVVENHNKHLILTNDKVKEGRVTKLKLVITDMEAEEAN